VWIVSEDSDQIGFIYIFLIKEQEFWPQQFKKLPAAKQI
jgi:hypothetical protein